MDNEPFQFFFDVARTKAPISLSEFSISWLDVYETVIDNNVL